MIFDRNCCGSDDFLFYFDGELADELVVCLVACRNALYDADVLAVCFGDSSCEFRLDKRFFLGQWFA